ncbi:hypothetical protein BKA56DRAFT_610478 [Ilyonectria sp. MPI-CAGE-AT-0026]|nr:hypothetical protein BKA56DRAFT_610478 [Ilyonectria sp. MPI-CAGE-AT-0026]
MLRGFSCAATGRRFLPCPYLCSRPLTLPLDQAGLDWVCRPSAESVHNSVCLLAGLSAWSDALGPGSSLKRVDLLRSAPYRAQASVIVCLARDAAATLAMLAMLKIRSFLSRTDQARESRRQR